MCDGCVCVHVDGFMHTALQVCMHTLACTPMFVRGGGGGGVRVHVCAGGGGVYMCVCVCLISISSAASGVAILVLPQCDCFIPSHIIHVLSFTIQQLTLSYSCHSY